MEDLARKVAFLESRLTLLERKFEKVFSEADIPQETVPPDGKNWIACDDPGLIISESYPAEYDEAGKLFCWIGGDGPIQMVFPFRPFRSAGWRLKLQFHPAVDFSKLEVFANDELCPKSIAHMAGFTEVRFDVPPSKARSTSVSLMNVPSVRPSEIGENEDQRSLAARFFGAEVVLHP